jgi:hypothetical protein
LRDKQHALKNNIGGVDDRENFWTSSPHSKIM